MQHTTQQYQQHNLFELHRVSSNCRRYRSSDPHHPDLGHVPRHELPTNWLVPHVRGHLLRIHMEREDHVRLDMLSEKRSLDHRVFVPTELTVIGAQPNRREVILVHPRRRGHLVSVER